MTNDLSVLLKNTSIMFGPDVVAGGWQECFRPGLFPLGIRPWMPYVTPESFG